MSEVMRRLKEDHEGVERLLAVLEGQIDAVGSADRADFALMLDVMHYMVHYPDEFHHPREDLVFEQLKASDARVGELLATLFREHRSLLEKGRHLHQPSPRRSGEPSPRTSRIRPIRCSAR